MNSSIQEALTQVRQLHKNIIEKQRFYGYSGRARLISGLMALATAILLSRSSFPRFEIPHLIAWGILFILSVALNYGALLYWFISNPKSRQDLRYLRPVLDVFPIFFVAGIISLSLILNHQTKLLFGIWMTHFGAIHLISRHILPKGTRYVGFYYILAGSICLLITPDFYNPWPMGLVFFFGEWFGGLVFHWNRKTGAAS